MYSVTPKEVRQPYNSSMNPPSRRFFAAGAYHHAKEVMSCYPSNLAKSAALTCRLSILLPEAFQCRPQIFRYCDATYKVKRFPKLRFVSLISTRLSPSVRTCISTVERRFLKDLREKLEEGGGSKTPGGWEWAALVQCVPPGKSLEGESLNCRTFELPYLSFHISGKQHFPYRGTLRTEKLVRTTCPDPRILVFPTVVRRVNLALHMCNTRSPSQISICRVFFWISWKPRSRR